MHQWHAVIEAHFQEAREAYEVEHAAEGKAKELYHLKKAEAIPRRIKQLKEDEVTELQVKLNSDYLRHYQCPGPSLKR